MHTKCRGPSLLVFILKLSFWEIHNHYLSSVVIIAAAVYLYMLIV